MNKEELETGISKINDIFENMSSEEIKNKMIEQKDKTMKEIKNKFELVLEVDNLIKNKDIEDIKFIIMFLINKI
jgi:hypothetical protein